MANGAGANISPQRVAPSLHTINGVSTVGWAARSKAQQIPTLAGGQFAAIFAFCHFQWSYAPEVKCT